MPVRKQFYPGGPHVSPIVRSAKAPAFALPPIQPEPTTARGRRRSQNTAEYRRNCELRSQQSYPQR